MDKFANFVKEAFEYLRPHKGGPKSYFALAVVLGGILGYLYPYNYLWVFGFADGGSTHLFLQLAGLGVLSGGWEQYVKIERGADLAHFETQMLAGWGAALTFLGHVGMGYAFSIPVLIVFALTVAAYATYARYVWFQEG